MVAAAPQGVRGDQVRRAGDQVVAEGGRPVLPGGGPADRDGQEQDQAEGADEGAEAGVSDGLLASVDQSCQYWVSWLDMPLPEGSGKFCWTPCKPLC